MSYFEDLNKIKLKFVGVAFVVDKEMNSTNNNSAALQTLFSSRFIQWIKTCFH